LCGNQATAHYNWLIASQYNVGGALEITPSTAVDGATFSTPTAVFTHTGRVGIGTTSPSFDLTVDKDINSLTTAYVRSYNTGSSAGGRLIAASAVGNLSMTAFSAAHSVWPNTAVIASESGFTGGLAINAAGANPLQFYTNSSERARIDSSGRLLVGTSNAVTGVNQPQYARLQVVGNTLSGARSGLIALGRSAAASTIVAGDQLGGITFGDNAAGEFAYIFGEADGTAGTNDYPGRLVFSVTADGASSPTEAMRIKNSRILNFANTPTYADNTAAKAGGLVNGDVYRKSDGTLMIVYT
jgi:hypothetical protein